MLVKYQIFDMFITNIPCTELVTWAQNTKGAQDLKATCTMILTSKIYPSELPKILKILDTIFCIEPLQTKYWSILLPVHCSMKQTQNYALDDRNTVQFQLDI